MRQLFAFLVLLGMAGSAVAADATSRNGLPIEIAGSTLRAEIWTGDLNEQHLWRFRPDGTAAGSMWALRAGQRAGRWIEMNDEGRWRVSDGRLCVTWRLLMGGGTHCYALAPVRPRWVRFSNESGGASFIGQVDPS